MSDQAAAPKPEDVKPAPAPAAPAPEPEIVVEDDAKIWAELEALENGKAVETPADKAAEVKRTEDAFAGDPENAIDESASPPAAAAPAQAPAAAGGGAPAASPDIWANAPPELKAAYDAQVKALGNATSDQSRRSIQGRIDAYSRRLDERSRAAAAPPAKEEPEPDPLATVKADYPEIAEPFEKKHKQIEEKISKFEAKEKAAQEAADAQMDQDLLENERLLESKHPGVWDLLKDNAKTFGTWIVDQPLEIRKAFHVNRNAIVDLDGAVKTFDGFKAHLAALNPPQTPTPAPAPAPTPAPTKEPSLKRAAQLAGSETPKVSGGRPAVSGIPESGDDQAIWNAFAANDPEEQKYKRA